MAHFIGGIAASHTPTIGVALRRSAVERDLVARRDWRGLMHRGAIFFALERLGAVVGVSNLPIYAAMRGQSLEEFQRTRNPPGALCSVAGKDAGAMAWERTPPSTS